MNGGRIGIGGSPSAVIAGPYPQVFHQGRGNDGLLWSFMYTWATTATKSFWIAQFRVRTCRGRLPHVSSMRMSSYSTRAQGPQPISGSHGSVEAVARGSRSQTRERARAEADRAGRGTGGPAGPGSGAGSPQPAAGAHPRHRPRPPTPPAGEAHPGHRPRGSPPAGGRRDGRGADAPFHPARPRAARGADRAGPAPAGAPGATGGRRRQARPGSPHFADRRAPRRHLHGPHPARLSCGLRTARRSGWPDLVPARTGPHHRVPGDGDAVHLQGAGPADQAHARARGPRPGVYLSHAPHEVLFQTPSGEVQADGVRLAGNVLLFDHRGVTVRIEGLHTLAQALALARSLH